MTVLQDDVDFLVELVDFNGKPAVKKSAKDTTRPERLERLQNEAYGLGFFANLSAKNPQLDLYIPKLYEAGERYIVSEYIDSPSVGDNLDNLGKLARLLAGIDHIAPYGEAKITPNFDYHNIRVNFDNWTKGPLASGQIKPQQLAKANQILDKLGPYIRPRIAHGDLSPYAHAYMRPDGKIALVDLEVFTPAGARYYDVARCYTRLYGATKSTYTPKRFLGQFMSFADRPEHRDEQLLAIILQRTVGMQRDAVVDSKKGANYKQRAAELLNLVLKGKLELLYS